MDTRYFIEHYGSQIEALKADLIAIMAPQTAYQAPQRAEATVQSATEKASVEATGNETVLFLSPAAKAEALRKGRKAAAGLAKAHQNRQRQPSFA